MIPYMSLFRRLIAWLLWRYEGFESLDDAAFYVLDHPDLTRVASLLRDYWYIKKAKEYERQEKG